MLEAPPEEERAFAALLGRILQAGVIAAACFVVSGGGVYLWNRGGSQTDYRVFRGEPVELRSVHGIFTEARAGSGRGLIQLGLLLLVATPIVRVLCSVIGFARERDWTYLTITLIVLAILGYSLFVV